LLVRFETSLICAEDKRNVPVRQGDFIASAFPSAITTRVKPAGRQ
jgi:hypothetical protein